MAYKAAHVSAARPILFTATPLVSGIAIGLSTRVRVGLRASGQIQGITDTHATATQIEHAIGVIKL